MKVCWFSTGISSFVACYLAKDVDEIIYTHVSNQHPDSLRFLHDCEKLLGRKITIIQSEQYSSVDDVIEKTRCINTPFGAPCTDKLKKRVRMKWEREHPDHHIYVWGYDLNEKNRADRVCENERFGRTRRGNQATPERGKIKKCDCREIQCKTTDCKLLDQKAKNNHFRPASPPNSRKEKVPHLHIQADRQEPWKLCLH